MNREILENLKKLNEEEVEIKKGLTQINRDIYMSKTYSNIIDSKKLLEKGKLITVRPHTRFVHFPKHTHNYVELVYMCEGSTTHIVNEERITLNKGELLFLSQNATQEILEASENDICVNFIILPEFFDTTLSMLGEEENLLRDFFVDCLKSKDSSIPFLHFKVSDIVPVQNLVENLIWTLTNKQSNKRSINKITMGLLILQLLNHTDKITVGKDNLNQDILVRTYEFVEENYKDGELTDLAEKLGYELSWLSREIKTLTGQNYTEIVQTKRLNQTVFLLKNTTLSVADIGYNVGYSNLSYFYKIFKNKYGMSPKEYRKSI